MKKIMFILNFALIICLMPVVLSGQNYTSYFTGNTNNITTIPLGGICLMGGATESDNAMKWFLQRANGGDILVLRTSGSNGYNNYMYSQLGITVNSVETIVCHNQNASNDAYVKQKIQQAEAIWFAGGDQWTYVSYWRNTPVDSLINLAILQRNIVIGGTSAGMAIQGKYYYTAQNGTVTSVTALGNPFVNTVTVDSTKFIKNNILSNLITDTHFDNPDRRGRLVTFLARIFTDYGILGKAIACDEYTAVCIDNTGIAKVFGGYPTYNDYAYFIQTNCELSSQSPENCSIGEPLTWNLSGSALRVYRINGEPTGNQTFNLNDWKTGVGGQWLSWSVNNGSFLEQTGNPINCSGVSVTENYYPAIDIFPNPNQGRVFLTINEVDFFQSEVNVYNTLGKLVYVSRNESPGRKIELDLSHLSRGVYFLVIKSNNRIAFTKKLIKE